MNTNEYRAVTTHGFKRGQRVSAVVYGQTKTGVVQFVGRQICWVRWDDSIYTHFMHPESLKRL